MIQLLKQPVGLSFVAVIVVFCMAAWFLPPRLVIEIGDAFAIPMALAASVVYFRAVLDRRARAEGRGFGPAHLTMLAIAGAWLTNCLDRMMRLLARLYDVSLADSAVIGLSLFMLCFFAALHLVAIGIRLRWEEPPYPGTRIVWIALAAGCVLALLVVYHEWPHLKGALMQ